MKKILVFGVSGMLGNAVMYILSRAFDYQVFGTVRSRQVPKFFSDSMVDNVLPCVDICNDNDILDAFSKVNPDVVINCVGIIKQLQESNNPLAVLPINSMLPHKLSKLCALSKARLIHISTDCVFSGARGNYLETDTPDAIDLYGVSKRIGEVGYGNAVTLRTSIIGHEIGGCNALVDWFLSQTGPVRGYKEAYFSGLPTCELAAVIGKHVIPNEQLSGLFHVAAKRISKYELLKGVAQIYGHEIDVVADGGVKIDRSLNSQRFNELTGYSAPNWIELLKSMHDYYKIVKS